MNHETGGRKGVVDTFFFTKPGIRAQVIVLERQLERLNAEDRINVYFCKNSSFISCEAALEWFEINKNQSNHAYEIRIRSRRRHMFRERI